MQEKDKTKCESTLGFLILLVGCTTLVITFMLFPNPIHPVASLLVMISIILIISSIPFLLRYEDHKSST